MSYEVELLKAWMDQGHRTEYDGTPIPPVMPEPTPTGEPTWASDPAGQVERLADYLNDCDGADPDLPAVDQAMNLLTAMRQMVLALGDKLRKPDPLPEGARASVSDDAVFSPDEHSVHFEVSMVVDGDPAEFASRAHAWLAAVLSRAKDGS